MKSRSGRGDLRSLNQSDGHDRYTLTFVVAQHGSHIRLGGNFYLHPMEWKIDLTEPLNQVKLDGTGPR